VTSAVITPLRDIVLVQLAPNVAPPTASGIVVQRREREPSTHATVVAVGAEVVDARRGDAVVISRLQGIDVGDGALLLPESAILAKTPTDAELSDALHALRPNETLLPGSVLPEDDDSFGDHLTGGVDTDV
jgi:co-chaperonin GroES (HSP10)